MEILRPVKRATPACYSALALALAQMLRPIPDNEATSIEVHGR